MEKSPHQAVASPALSERNDYPRLFSADILKGNTVIEINHAGQRYLLRVTRDNKLILTK
jgi:hemin uptake protein HemP